MSALYLIERKLIKNSKLKLRHSLLTFFGISTFRATRIIKLFGLPQSKLERIENGGKYDKKLLHYFKETEDKLERVLSEFLRARRRLLTFAQLHRAYRFLLGLPSRGQCCSTNGRTSKFRPRLRKLRARYGKIRLGLVFSGSVNKIKT
jgi:ribosomal protein S13